MRLNYSIVVLLEGYLFLAVLSLVRLVPWGKLKS